MERFINLTAGHVTYTGAPSLIQFIVEDPKMMMPTSKYAVVQITFKRLSVYHLSATFIPTILLMTVTQIILFVDYEEHFDVVTMVNLTTMLVIYTFYASISNSMPPTAYLKFIDIWLLYCLTSPFIAFVIAVLAKLLNLNQTADEVKNVIQVHPEVTQTTIETHEQDVQPRKSGNVLMKRARFILPSITVAFIVVYTVLVIILF